MLYWYFQTCYWRPLLTQKLPCYKKWLLLLLLSHFSRFRLCVTLWTTACQAPLFMRFSRQEYWSGLPCPPPGDLPAQGWTWVFCNVDSFFITELPGKPTSRNTEHRVKIKVDQDKSTKKSDQDLSVSIVCSRCYAMNVFIKLVCFNGPVC